MSYTPPAAMLRGLSVEAAQKFGMPHIGAHYEGRGVRTNRLDEDAACAFCRARATNAHHVPNVGMGARNSGFHLDGWFLRPALIALCGSGTTGCHGDCHNGRMHIAWHWDSDEYARAWWEGELLREYGPHSPMLYCYGEWVITRRGIGTVRRIRA